MIMVAGAFFLVLALRLKSYFGGGSSVVIMMAGIVYVPARRRDANPFKCQ